MRELHETELDRVAGSGLNLLTGAAGAVGGGLAAGAAYAYDSSIDGTFTWGGFAYHVAVSSASGFLIGTGASLFAAGMTGALPGAQVLGVSVGGAGAVLGMTTSIDEKKAGS